MKHWPAAHIPDFRRGLHHRRQLAGAAGRRAGRPRRAMRLPPVLVVLVLALSVLAAPATPAGAWTTRVLSGRPGNSAVPVTIGDWHPTYVKIVLPNRYVSRSPATTGRQYVRTTYRLWRYNWTFGSWRFVQQNTDPRQTIPAGYRRAIYPGWIFDVNTEGLFAVDFYLTWRRPDGRLLGQRYYWQNATGDYRCAWADPEQTRCLVQETRTARAFS